MLHIFRVPLLGGFFTLLFMAGCQSNQPETTTTQAPVFLRFELDSTGKITDAAVVGFLTELAALISENGNKIMLHSYVESMGNPDEEVAVATAMAQAAKNVMVETGLPRMYYNVGMDIHGATNTIEDTQPTAIENRRIEIEFL